MLVKTRGVTLAAIQTMMILIATCSRVIRTTSAWAPAARICIRPSSPTVFGKSNRLYGTNGRRSISIMKATSQNLLSVEECLDLFNTDESVVFVDASWYHKGERNGRAEFEAGPRIPGARHMDMSDICTSKELFPEQNPLGLYQMLPPKHLFAAAMDAFKIKNSDQIIIYAREGSIFTPRTWFLFRSMGHDNVQLMQGSLEDWIKAGGPIEEGPTVVLKAKDLDLSQPTSYQITDNQETPSNVIDMDAMLSIVENQKATIIDPRGSSFAKGYIPGAIHLPYSSLVKADNQLQLKPKDELEKLFQDAGVDIHSENPIVCSCGSGVSACHVYLALQEIGRTGETVVYDGSWNEWSKNPDAPKVLPKKDDS